MIRTLIAGLSIFIRRNALVAASATLMIAGLLPACKNDPKPSPAVLQAAQTDPELANLNTLLAQNPKDDSLLYRRAKIYYKLEGYDEALNDISAAMKLDSSKAPYYHLMADVLMDYARPNDSKMAIRVLTRAAEKFPNRIPTLLKLSEFQLIVRKHGDALTTLNKILIRDPQNAEAFFMSGRVALDKGDTLNAIGALRKSVQIDAQNVEAWMFLGKIFSRRNNPQAIQYFDNALRIDSNFLEAREYKGAYYKRRGEFDKAFEVYHDIIVRNPDYANAYFDMGMIYLEQDSLNKAYANFDIATKTDVLFVEAFYYRGLCAEMMGNTAGALSDYTKANKMSPDFEEAKEAKARLEKK